MTLSVILDGIMICLLAGTIFYAARLSIHIRAFRDNRKELESLIGDLTSNIEKAGDAVDGLRESARQSGRDLQALINEARGLSEELQIMSESGNSLASRLERLAEKNTRPAAPHKPLPDFPPSVPPRPVRAAPPPSSGKAPPLRGFAIRDPEFEKDEAGEGMNEAGLMAGDEAEDAIPATLVSRAEKELYEALRRKKTEAGGMS